MIADLETFFHFFFFFKFELQFVVTIIVIVTIFDFSDDAGFISAWIGHNKYDAK